MAIKVSIFFPARPHGGLVLAQSILSLLIGLDAGSSIVALPPEGVHFLLLAQKHFVVFD